MPFDIVSARGRSPKLLGFEYKWEVYVHAPKRRWGYYVLPILYVDALVARLDAKLDRTTMTLAIKRFWNEHHAPVKDVQFEDALALGVIRFAKFVHAKKMYLTGFGRSVCENRFRLLFGRICEQLPKHTLNMIVVESVPLAADGDLSVRGYSPKALEITASKMNMTTAARIAPQPQPVETPHAWRVVIPGSNLRM